MDRTSVEGDRLVVMNPESGSADHGETVRALAAERGYAVYETGAAGEAVDAARQAAADGVHTIGACGGDGTVNEVVRGVVDADALERVTLGVLPAGTGNNFAGNIGVEGIEHGFSLLDSGETRRIDLGVANGHPFANSCVGGLTADASERTSSSGKRRFGVLAYLLATIETAREFDGLPLRVRARTAPGRETVWNDDAAFVLVGNARRFPIRGRTQANVEDGLFDVTIVEDMPAASILGEAAIKRLLGGETAGTTRLLASEVDVVVGDDESTSFSFDGEMRSLHRLSCRVREGSLAVRVGESYEPSPEDDE